MRRLALILLATAAVAACNKAAEPVETATDAVPPLGASADPFPAENVGASAEPAQPMPPLAAPLLAYAYQFQLTAQADPLRQLMVWHQQACESAGPSVCQVVGAASEGRNDDVFRATLTLRAAPDWVARFRLGLEKEMAAVGGRVTESSTATEDLTRGLVDTEAAVRAKMTLRDRLQRTLATRPGKLPEMLQIEQELARVQAEIDAAQSQLAIMRTRVAAQVVTLRYDSAPVFAASGDGAPVVEAVSDIVPTLATITGILIRIVTVLSPWALLTLAVVWVVRRLRPRSRDRAGGITNS